MEQKQNWFMRHKILTAILVILLIGLIFGEKNKTEKTANTTNSSITTNQEVEEIKEAEKVKTPDEVKEERKKVIEKQFSAWDGSHNKLTQVILKGMNDPDSYDHIETLYSDYGDHLIVTTTFRGKNAFGGIVKNTVTAKIDPITGGIIEIIE